MASWADSGECRDMVDERGSQIGWRAPPPAATVTRARMALLVVAGLLATAAGFVGATRLSTSNAGRSDEVEVLLEAADAAGPDAFMPSVATADVEQVQVLLTSVAPRPSASPAALTEDVGATPQLGTAPGLYGGSGDGSVCDAAALVGYLGDHPDKAAAWAAVMGIDVAEIESFVGTLTPVVLTADTLVTNHGFAAGKPTPRQSVLQAGTAVMIDPAGVPRVKCGCGNPLGEPEALGGDASVTFGGDAWEGFDPHALEVVRPGSEETDTFEVAALDGSGIVAVTAGAPSVTAAEILNATVPTVCGGEAVSFVDGQDPRLGADPLLGFTSMTEPVIGDLDGAPGDEGAVVIQCNAGGNTSAFDVRIFRAGPRSVAVPITDGLSSDFMGLEWVSDLAIEDGWLRYHAAGLGTSDAFCCPSRFVSRRYRLEGDTPVVAPPPADLQLTSAGLGPVIAGMTYAEAALVMGRELGVSSIFDEADPAGASCVSADFVGLDVGGTGGDGLIGAFSVFEGDIRTDKGVGLGDSLSDVLAAYPTAHPEVNIYQDEADYYVDETIDGERVALRFVLAGGTVRGMLAGARWAVELQEGCL